MLSLGPALVALSLPSRTPHIKMQEAFSPLALLGDAYDGALNSLIGPLGLEEAGRRRARAGRRDDVRARQRGRPLHAGGGRQLRHDASDVLGAAGGRRSHYVCQVHVDGPAKRVTLRRDHVPRAPGGRERYLTRTSKNR